MGAISAVNSVRRLEAYKRVYNIHVGDQTVGRGFFLRKQSGRIVFVTAGYPQGVIESHAPFCKEGYYGYKVELSAAFLDDIFISFRLNPQVVYRNGQEGVDFTVSGAYPNANRFDQQGFRDWRVYIRSLAIPASTTRFWARPKLFRPVMNEQRAQAELGFRPERFGQKSFVMPGDFPASEIGTPIFNRFGQPVALSHYCLPLLKEVTPIHPFYRVPGIRRILRG